MEELKNKDKYELFWDWFNKRQEYIYDHLETDTDNVALEIQKELKTIHEDLAFEISFEKVQDKRNFVVSADGNKHLFPIVIEFTNKAPVYKHWNITPFRPRLNQFNQVIEMEGIKLDYDDIYFNYIEDDEEDKIHLNVFVQGYDGEDNRYVHAYFLLLDSLVGEYDAVTKIGETIMYSLEPDISVELHKFKELIQILDELDKTTEVN